MSLEPIPIVDAGTITTVRPTLETVLYDALRFLLNSLHSICVLTANSFLSLFPEHTDVWFSLPSGLSVRIATWNGVSYDIPNFADLLPDVNQWTRYTLKLPFFNLKWIMPAIRWTFPDMVLPELSNFEIVHNPDLYWKVIVGGNETYVQGKDITPERNYMAADLALDVALAALLAAFVYALTHMGLVQQVEMLVKKYFTKFGSAVGEWRKYQQTIQIITNTTTAVTKATEAAETATRVEEDLSDLSDEFTGFGESLDEARLNTVEILTKSTNILSSVNTIAADVSALIATVSVVELIPGMVTTLTEIKDKLDGLSGAIGLRLRFL